MPLLNFDPEIGLGQLNGQVEVYRAGERLPDSIDRHSLTRWGRDDLARRRRHGLAGRARQRLNRLSGIRRLQTERRCEDQKRGDHPLIFRLPVSPDGLFPP